MNENENEINKYFVEDELIDPAVDAKTAAKMNIQKSLKAQAIDAVSCNMGYGDIEFAREVYGEAKMAYVLGEIPREVFYEFHDLLICLFNVDGDGVKESCQKRIAELGW